MDLDSARSGIDPSCRAVNEKEVDFVYIAGEGRISEVDAVRAIGIASDSGTGCGQDSNLEMTRSDNLPSRQ